MRKTQKALTVEHVAERVGQELLIAKAFPSEPVAKQDFELVIAAVALGRKPKIKLTAEHIRVLEGVTETLTPGLTRQVGLPDGTTYRDAVNRLYAIAASKIP